MVRAKFRVNDIQHSLDGQGEPYSEMVQLNPVYSNDPQSENRQFWDATPAGTLTMWINNKAAFGLFERGKEYYLDFTPAE